MTSSFLATMLVSLILKTILIYKANETGLQNYAIITQTENSCIKCNSNKINSLQRYDTAQNYRILHQAVQHFSQHNHKISNHHHIQKLCKKIIIK
jgi:hypothetical protein